MQKFSILGGAAIIAAAILYVFRWEVAMSPDKIVLLDRWTGHAVQCTRKLDLASMLQKEYECNPVNGG